MNKNSKGHFNSEAQQERQSGSYANSSPYEIFYWQHVFIGTMQYMCVKAEYMCVYQIAVCRVCVCTDAQV